jgi:DNA-binding MarR family transcriptional regulator
MFCPECGAEVGEKHNFCSNCGKDLRKYRQSILSKANRKVKAKSKKSTKKTKKKKIKCSLPPVQLSVLMAVKHGISNTEIIAKMVRKSHSYIRNTVDKLIKRDLLRVKKKGFFRKKKYYELTPKAEKIVEEDRKKIGRIIREDEDDAMRYAAPIFVMSYLNDLPQGVSQSEVAEVVAIPEEDYSSILEDVNSDDAAFDDSFGYGGSDDGDDGDWGDGGDDGGW